MAALNPRLADSEQFGRYRIIKRLGQGGMGSVYLAQDTHLERPVALKVPDFGEHETPEARRRFLEEVRTAATLDHPYLCPVYDAGEIEGQPYLTMAYIEGQSLAALIGEQGWPERQVAALVGKLAVALQEAHRQKVVHRDLKPANIMIKKTGGRREPVIVNFGLARRDNPQEQRLTKSGQLVGTLGYMAPEQIRGDLNEIGPPCDIYALGVILYELLTGRLPFSGSGLGVAAQILTQAPLPPSTDRPDLHPALEAICLKAMAKTIGDRYASMAELAAALTGFLQWPSASPTPTEKAGSAGSPSPASDQQAQRAGTSSLVGQFLAQLAGSGEPPSPIPDPVASQARSPGRRGPAWPMIVAAAALVVIVLSVIIYDVVADKGRGKNATEHLTHAVKVDGDHDEATDTGSVKNTTERLTDAVNVDGVQDKAPPAKYVPQIEKGRSASTEKVTEADPWPQALGVAGRTVADERVAPAAKKPSVPTAPEETEKRNLRVGYGRSPADDRVVFLSDLRPLNFKPNRPGSFATNGALGKSKERIRIKGEESPHGLFLHPFGQGHSEVTYAIDGKWNRFEGSVAICQPSDRQDYDGPPLTFEVIGDNKVLWTSIKVTKFDEPQAFSIDVAFVNQLRLRVTCPDRNDLARMVWVEPRLRPPRLAFVEEYDGPRTGLPRDVNIPHDPEYGRSDGVFFVYSAGGWRTRGIHEIRSDGTCEVVGRVLSEDPRKTAASLVVVTGVCTLRLMSSAKNVSDIPRQGRDLMIVAAVGGVLHFRIFDHDGKLVVENDENSLRARTRQIEDLRWHLVGLWPPHELTQSEKGRVVTAVTSIVGHDPSGKLAGRGFLIRINVKGELFLEPSPWDEAEAFRQIDPKIGPITHSVIKPGNEFNKLLLLVKKREVVIFVNDVQVCHPVRFDYDVTPDQVTIRSYWARNETGRIRSGRDS